MILSLTPEARRALKKLAADYGKARLRGWDWLLERRPSEVSAKASKKAWKTRKRQVASRGTPSKS